MRAVIVRRLLLGSILALIFTLYLAPSKNEMADCLVVLLLVAMATCREFGMGQLLQMLRPLVPLLLLIAYAGVLGIFGYGDANGHFVYDIAIGFIPYVLLYILFSRAEKRDFGWLFIAIFLIPGLIHLIYMYFDILKALAHDQLALLTSSRQGFLEYGKDAPRVGRRYLSVALVHLLIGCFLVSTSYRNRIAPYAVASIVTISLLSLALLDARAAVVSLFLGGIFIVVSMGMRIIWPVGQFFLAQAWWKKILCGCLVIMMLGIGFSAGKSRWIAMSYSLKSAAYDVFESPDDIASRPYVNAVFWSAPIVDIGECMRNEHFRCKADQSAYLRLAWLLDGIRSASVHPFGIGYWDNYMGRLWGVDGVVGKYQRADNFLVMQLVSFGLVGISLYLMLWVQLGISLRRIMRQKKAMSIENLFFNGPIIICGIIFICAGRSLVDVFSDGLWSYMLALLGMYYGLVDSRWRRVLQSCDGLDRVELAAPTSV